nr:hypothetical protein [Tanacetum cinerariifolium]
MEVIEAGGDGGGSELELEGVGVERRGLLPLLLKWKTLLPERGIITWLRRCQPVLSDTSRAALKSLSEINLTNDQSAESLAAAIVTQLETAIGLAQATHFVISNTVDQDMYCVGSSSVNRCHVYLQSEITSIEEELLHRFMSNDVCPMSYGLIDILLNTGRPKDENSSREALIRSFQLAFSLLNISLAEGGFVQNSSREALIQSFQLAFSLLNISLADG